ncbi:hypothetical protein [Pseudomonas sp. Sample_22]|uniref:hypothetical protein n=1 Tax=Pseudomonas sp. Sample_22 TaxID=2448266 RepID=UPI001032A99F|nr:hypothetical protein [Pseudomonas sp. Sample_22]
MDEQTERELNDYLSLLFWTETASVAEIQGAMSVASGVTKQDLKMAIRCMMDSDRPALANDFPELLANRVTLSGLRSKHIELAKAMAVLEESLKRREHDPSYPLKGYGLALGCVRKMQNFGNITAAQRELLLSELVRIKRGDMRDN